MKIAYVSNYLGPEYLKKYCDDINFSVSATFKSTAINRALLKAGHEIIIYSPGITVCNQFIKSFNEKIEYPEGNLIVKYPFITSYRKCSIINSLFLIKSMIQDYKNNPFDILIYYNISIDAALCLHYFRETINILEYEDNIFNKALKNNKNRFERGKKALFNYVIKRTDAAITVCVGMLNNNEVKSKVIIPGALNEDVLNNICVENCTSIISSPIKLVLAGGLHYSKGPDLILKALKYIDYPCEIYFYGNGKMDSDTEKLLQSMPSRHRVIIGGFIQHDKLIKILVNEAHILLNTTRSMGVPKNSEGFPFKMIEYAATGKPIVSSTIGHLDADFNNLITYYDDENPKEIAEAINFVINNYEECVARAKKLKNLVLNEYTIQGISTKLKEFFANLKMN